MVGQRLARADARAGAGGGVLLRAAAGGAPRHAVHRPARPPRPARWAWTCCASRCSGGASPASRLTGALNVTVSFWLAFKVALRSRGIQVRERERIARGDLAPTAAVAAVVRLADEGLSVDAGRRKASRASRRPPGDFTPGG
ncbi:MAG: site-specific recombinase [Comamonadaceae bacterium]|nr:site-specific recombinase [Comamonadaceae bacterium]